ncbi:MAG: hypothetical protein WAP35_05655 [Solirubrobacterales bacterium]
MSTTGGRRTRAIVLVDGEHHPGVVHDAVEALSAQHEIAALVFCGGSEKVGQATLADAERVYGYDLTFGDDPEAALQSAIAGHRADLVIDLADEPIVPLSAKLRLAALAMAAGLAYEAPGMRLDPIEMRELEFAGPKIAVIGTAKRTGKTAICGHLAGLIASAGGAPAIVSMGRGGPPTPQLAHPHTGLDELLALARSGVHAASDYLEDAVLAGVPTVGCRRVGGGPGGQSGPTNFVEGAVLAAGIPGVDFLLFEGSGATVPPVTADITICVTASAEQSSTLAGPLRLALADLVLVHADEPGALDAARRWTRGEVVPFSLIPGPAGDIPAEARVAFFSTGLGEPEGVEAVVTSRNLARRAELEADLNRAAAAGCTHYLTELKAAAIDLVAERAQREGAEVVFVRNRPVTSDADLDEILLTMHERANNLVVARAGGGGDA